MIKALIVDDEQMALLSTRYSLPFETFGFNRVDLFSDPFAAKEALLSGQYDAAFIDIRMPGLSGLDLIAAVQNAGLATACIIVSGHSDFDYLRQAIQRGAVDYCLKPIHPEEADNLMRNLWGKINAYKLQNDGACLSKLLHHHNPKTHLLP